MAMKGKILSRVLAVVALSRALTCRNAAQQSQLFIGNRNMVLTICQNDEVLYNYEMQTRYPLELDSFTGVSDPQYQKGLNNIDVLALGVIKLKLEEYRAVLKHPRVLAKWGEFLIEEQENGEILAQRTMEWYDKYNKKVDEFNDMMVEYYGRRNSR